MDLVRTIREQGEPMSTSRSFAVGALSLVAAGVIGGGVAVALSAQDAPQTPVELRQVAETATATTTTTTVASPSPTVTTATPTTVKVVKASPSTSSALPKRQVARLAPAAEPEPSPSSTTPEPVTTTPVDPPATHDVPPVIPGNGPHVCGTGACPSE